MLSPLPFPSPSRLRLIPFPLGLKLVFTFPFSSHLPTSLPPEGGALFPSHILFSYTSHFPSNVLAHFYSHYALPPVYIPSNFPSTYLLLFLATFTSLLPPSPHSYSTSLPTFPPLFSSFLKLLFQMHLC
jgi:hypothetical protein